jgi:hypothetical protein
MKGCFFLTLWITGIVIGFLLLGPYALPVLGLIILWRLLS